MLAALVALAVVTASYIHLLHRNLAEEQRRAAHSAPVPVSAHIPSGPTVDSPSTSVGRASSKRPANLYQSVTEDLVDAVARCVYIRVSLLEVTDNAINRPGGARQAPSPEPEDDVHQASSSKLSRSSTASTIRPSVPTPAPQSASYDHLAPTSVVASGSVSARATSPTAYFPRGATPSDTSLSERRRSVTVDAPAIVLNQRRPLTAEELQPPPPAMASGAQAMYRVKAAPKTPTSSLSTMVSSDDVAAVVPGLRRPRTTEQLQPASSVSAPSGQATYRVKAATLSPASTLTSLASSDDMDVRFVWSCVLFPLLTLLQVDSFTPVSDGRRSRSQTPSVASTSAICSWTGSFGAGIIDAPPADTDMDEHIAVGNIYRYIAYDHTPPVYQLWLRVAGADGRPFWKPVAVGYEREDGRKLILTLSKKNPSWVQESRFKAVQRAEKKAMMSQAASVSAPPGGECLAVLRLNGDVSSFS